MPAISPPLRRLLHRAIGIVILLLLLLALRLIWGGIARHRLKEQLAAMRSQPRTPAEMWPSTDPDPAHNAVPILIRAMTAAAAVNSAGIDSPSQSNITYPNYPPYNAAWHKLADAAIPANAKALGLARKARAYDHFRWTITPGSLLSSLNQARNLTNLLADAAIYTHFRGDDFEALERVRDALHLVAAVDAQHTQLSYLVAFGLHAKICDSLAVVALGLKIPPSDERSPIRKDVRAILNELLEERDQSEALRRSLVAERVNQLNNFPRVRSECWAIRPLFDLDLARVLKVDQQVLRATTQENLQTARSLLPPPPPIPTTYPPPRSSPGASPTPPRFSRPCSVSLLSSFNRIVEIAMRTRMDDRMTATSLAVQLYRADHAGLFPPALQALVPAYLTSVPVDPLAPAGEPIGYIILKHALPDGRDRPMLHSVGSNGQDDYRIHHQKPPTEPIYRWQGPRGALDDQFLDISRWAPTTQPAGSN